MYTLIIIVFILAVCSMVGMWVNYCINIKTDYPYAETWKTESSRKAQKVLRFAFAFFSAVLVVLCLVDNHS